MGGVVGSHSSGIQFWGCRYLAPYAPHAALVLLAALVLKLLVPGSHRFAPVAPGFGRIRSCCWRRVVLAALVLVLLASSLASSRRLGRVRASMPYQLGAMGNIPSPPNDLEMQFQSSY